MSDLFKVSKIIRNGYLLLIQLDTQNNDQNLSNCVCFSIYVPYLNIKKKT